MIGYVAIFVHDCQQNAYNVSRTSVPAPGETEQQRPPALVSLSFQDRCCLQLCQQCPCIMPSAIALKKNFHTTNQINKINMLLIQCSPSTLQTTYSK